MAVKVQSTIEPYNDSYFVANAKNIGVGDPGAETPLDEVLNDLPGGGGSEYEIPTFGLVELGLPTIIPNGESVIHRGDTTELMAALEKGAVKIIVNFNMGAEVAVSLVLNPASMIATGEYSCTIINEFNNTVLITTVGVGNGYIAVKCTPMDNIIGAYIDVALGGDY